MKNKLMVAFAALLIVTPVLVGTAQAKGGGCKVVYYGSNGPVCEPEVGPSKSKP